MDKRARLSGAEMARVVFKAFRVSLRTKTKLSAAVSVLGFGMAFVPVLSSNVLKLFSNQIQELSQSGGSVRTALALFAVLASLFLVQTVFAFFKNYTLESDSIRTNEYIRKTILRCTCKVRYQYIENYGRFKEKIAFADSYAGERVANSIQSITVWLQNLMLFGSVAYALLCVNVWIVVLLLATCIPAVVLSYLQKDEQYRNNVKWMKEGAMTIHYFLICAGPDAMNEIRHLGLIRFLKQRWRGIADRYIEKKNAMTRRHVLYNSAADILRNLVYIGVLLVAAAEIYQNPVIGIGTFMLVFDLSGQLQNTTTLLFVGLAQFYNDIYYMKDFFDLENLEYDERDPQAKPYESGSVSFENVSFSYPNSETEVLKQVSVTIRDGEKIAVVGENGSGKSTFVNLICGMYRVEKGRIQLSGRDLFQDLPRTRRTLSTVFQDFGKYETTIRENITISDESKQAADGELHELLKKAGLEEDVLNQEHGLEERVGMYSETGNNFSGGQWQKLALCRALYRDQAKVMILDEPTAALDPIAETNLYHNFTELTRGKTTILVSHRLGITSLVDRVLVFRDGRIVEDGSHKELMRRNGYYAQLYRSQAKWYEG